MGEEIIGNSKEEEEEVGGGEGGRVTLGGGHSISRLRRRDVSANFCIN